MNFKETHEIIESSNAFQNFKKQYPDAELCVGFFIRDFVTDEERNSLDYKTEDKIFTFDIKDNNEILQKEDKLIDEGNHPQLKSIKPEVKIEVDELKGLTGTQALDHGISAKFHKIIAVLQNHEDKQVWNLTCMLENLIILHILMDSETGEIIKFERKSMMDMIKKK
ncbi:hypothetical protein HOD75_00865 [archaeon]|jgi:hypothetical protein|nr:hypothetical protein [archaeon]MBT4241428.1 hypothetical protein [archaeon]MBT4417701.1 hypothetical protein [archaeon]